MGSIEDLIVSWRKLPANLGFVESERSVWSVCGRHGQVHCTLYSVPWSTIWDLAWPGGLSLGESDHVEKRRERGQRVDDACFKATGLCIQVSCECAMSGLRQKHGIRTYLSGP